MFALGKLSFLRRFLSGRVGRVSTRYRHVEQFDYLVVIHKRGVELGLTGVPLLLSYELRSDQAVTVVPDLVGVDVSVLDGLRGVLGVKRVSHLDVWTCLDEVVEPGGGCLYPLQGILSSMRRLLACLPVKVSAQLSYDLVEVLHNYPENGSDWFNARAVLSNLCVVHVYHRSRLKGDHAAVALLDEFCVSVRKGLTRAAMSR